MLTTTSTEFTSGVLLVQAIFENTRREKQSFKNFHPKILKIELKMEHFSIFESNPNHLVKSVFYKINYYAEKIMTLSIWHHFYDVIFVTSSEKRWRHRMLLFSMIISIRQYVTALMNSIPKIEFIDHPKFHPWASQIINSQEYRNIF